MSLPNDAPEIQSLPLYDIVGQASTPDTVGDKVVVLPFDVPHTNAKAGQVALFSPVPPGRSAKPTSYPIIVKTQQGAHHITGYAALHGAVPLEVVAVCRSYFAPARALDDMWE